VSDKCESKLLSVNKVGLTIAFSALLYASGSAFADTHYVSTNGTHQTPFTSWGTAATNLQSAVDVAGDGDEVKNRRRSILCST